MRSLIFLACLLPFLGNAQINRSARLLASEKVEEYVVKKLFRNKPYKSIRFGDIKPVQDNRSVIAWTITHDFEITTGGEQSFEHTAARAELYKFQFYLDEKMKVIKAETYYANQ